MRNKMREYKSRSWYKGQEQVVQSVRCGNTSIIKRQDEDLDVKQRKSQNESTREVRQGKMLYERHGKTSKAKQDDKFKTSQNKKNDAMTNSKMWQEEKKNVTRREAW